VLSLNALRGHERESVYTAQPIAGGDGRLPLATGLWIATSSQRPRGPLLEQAVALLAELLTERLASHAG
jgi:LysR family nitrogen assimilation transcriptional regulator